MNDQIAPYTGSALSAENLEHSIDLSLKLSKSDLLPPHFKGKPENVLLVLALAQNLNINPVMCLQQVSVIGGKPCLQASLMISLLNNSGKITGPLRFEWSGAEASPQRACVARATDAATGETVQSEPVSLAMAQAEGWTRNAKYKTIPDTMLKWRAASFFVRTYYPEVVLGLHSAEELTDVEKSERQQERPQSAVERLRELRHNEPRDVTETPHVAEPTLSESTVEFIGNTAKAQCADELNDQITVLNTLDLQGPELKAAKRAIVRRAEELNLTWVAEEEGYATKF